MKQEKEVIGIDLGNEYALISYYKPGMETPETVSMLPGSENYLFPVELYRSSGEEEWLFGEQAAKAAKQGNGICYKHLPGKAYENESIQFAAKKIDFVELLGIFLDRLIGMAVRAGVNRTESVVSVTVKQLDFEKAGVLWKALELAGIRQKQVRLLDYKESFFYFVRSQTQDRWLHDVVLFLLEGKKLEEYYWKRNDRTSPQTVTIEQKDFDGLNHVANDTQKDLAFQEIIDKEFQGKIISTAYLVGTEFESGWLEQSLISLCRQRKAYVGKNLFTKGACFGGMEKNGPEKAMIYVGASAMKINLTMKIHIGGKFEEVSLINAGDNCYESYCACDVLLDEEPYIDICKRNMQGKEEKISSLELTGLPKRPRKATKVHMQLIPVSDTQVKIMIEDRGLGELFPSSGKKWEFLLF